MSTSQLIIARLDQFKERDIKNNEDCGLVSKSYQIISLLIKKIGKEK
jgi:hypothetical protein